MTAENDGGPPGEEAVGSVAEEAAKLVGALQDWASEAGLGGGGAGSRGLLEGLHRLGSDHETHGAECSYCPLCRVVRTARSVSPEVREHLADAVGSLAQAATAALRSQPRAEDPESSVQRSTPAPSRIDLDD